MYTLPAGPINSGVETASHAGHCPVTISLAPETIHGSAICKGVGTLSQLPDILTLFSSVHSCPAPHILCIQFSFNLLDIH